jgi:hypothetical protein
MHRRGDLTTFHIGEQQIQRAVQDSREIAGGQRMAYQLLSTTQLVPSLLADRDLKLVASR